MLSRYPEFLILTAPVHPVSLLRPPAHVPYPPHTLRCPLPLLLRQKGIPAEDNSFHGSGFRYFCIRPPRASTLHTWNLPVPKADKNRHARLHKTESFLLIPSVPHHPHKSHADILHVPHYPDCWQKTDTPPVFFRHLSFPAG